MEVTIELIASILIIIVFLSLVIAIMIMIINKHNPEYDIYGEYEKKSEQTTVKAMLIDKGIEHTRSLASERFRYFTFQLEDGTRIYFGIENVEIFRTSVIGDEGVLTYKGRRFAEFKREMKN